MKYATVIVLGILFVFLVVITLGMLFAGAETRTWPPTIVGMLGTAAIYWIVVVQLPKLRRFWDENTL